MRKNYFLSSACRGGEGHSFYSPLTTTSRKSDFDSISDKKEVII